MLRGEPYTFEEFMAARDRVIGAGKDTILDEMFGGDLRAVGLQLHEDAGGDFGRMGSWTTGMMIGLCMAEARDDG